MLTAHIPRPPVHELHSLDEDGRVVRPHLYISGPMTGLPQLNFPAFSEAASNLRARGFFVINPAELNPDPKATWHECMRKDIRALCGCTAIVLLPGWEDSAGARLELHVAQQLGLHIVSLARALTMVSPA